MLNGQKPIQRAELRMLKSALKKRLIPNFGCAIDVGAHVGTWTEYMSMVFEQVIAFEPQPDSYEMLVANMADRENVEFLQYAAMHNDEMVRIHPDKKKRKHILTSWQVTPDKYGGTPSMTIDSLDLASCGLIKIDVEGAEPFVLAGATKTIAKFKPALIVEINEDCLKRFRCTPEQLRNAIIMTGYEEALIHDLNCLFIPCE